jgi:hypothetical protein
MTQRTYDPRTYDPRFDRRPTLLIWALATAVCVLVLAVAVFATVQPAAPPSTSNGNPAIHARSRRLWRVEPRPGSHPPSRQSG